MNDPTATVRFATNLCAVRSAPRRWILALRVPCGHTEPCRVIRLRASATELSDAIGGGLLDDALYGNVDGGEFCAYLDDERNEKDLPINGGAEVLMEELGCADQIGRSGLRGDMLVAGVDDHGNDADVPMAVLTAARAVGVFSHAAGAAESARDYHDVGRAAG